LLGPDQAADAGASSRRLRIGVDRAPMSHCDERVEAAFRNVVATVTAQNEVVPLDMPERTLVLDAHRTILLAEARDIYRSLTPAEVDRLAAIARRSLPLAKDITDAMLGAARRTAAAAVREVDALFGRVDLVLSPTICCPVTSQNARRVDIRGQSVSVVYALIANTVLFNVSGHPAIALPSNEMLDGVPFSVQIAARTDAALFDCARMFTSALRFSAEPRD